MSTRITLCAKSIRAMLHCAAQDDIRWYLNGVTVEPSGNKAILFATNGSMLASLMTETTFSGTAERIFIPRAAVARIPATASSVTLTQRKDTIILRIDCDERTTRESFKRLEDGNFHPIGLLTRKQPKSSTAPVPLNADYIATMMKTIIGLARARGLGRLKPAAQLSTRGAENGLLVLCTQLPEFAGLIMPMRYPAVDMPVWIQDCATKAAAAAAAKAAT